MFFSRPKPLSLKDDGQDWPHYDFSRSVTAFDVDWHVQEMGDPDAQHTIVLIHGTGASAHSWRDLMPLLAENHRVIALDLPGQGFTSPFDDADPSMPTMGIALAALLKALGVERATFVGHSAGAALALYLHVFDKFDAERIVSINGALYPFPGASSAFYTATAKLLFVNPFVPEIVSRNASDHGVQRLLDSTGSKLDSDGLKFYGRLFKNASHVRATLNWMANWDLKPLVSRLPDVSVPFLQIIGDRDKTISPDNAPDTEAAIEGARTVVMPGYGHLVHEEAPSETAAHIEAFLAEISA